MKTATKTQKVSQKYQIVVPKAVRESMGIKAGTGVYVTQLDERRALITKRSVDPVKELEGLGKEVWRALGGADKYIKQERASWGDR